MNDFVPVNQPLIGDLEEKYVLEAIRSGWISSDGPFVSEFESKFAEKVHRKYGVAVSNGSVALEIALKSLGIEKNDEVIVPSFTIISCLNAIVKVGAIPRFIDCYADTWNMNVEQVEKAINSNTKAIMVVHIYGLPTEMKQIILLARKYNLKIIEDAAEAHGQTYFDEPCGSFGDVSTFSFYANKHVTMGEGGIVVTNDHEIAEECRSLRNLYFKPEQRFVHDEIGSNYRITNLQAAVGLAQLEKLDQTIEFKRNLGRIYNEAFSDIEEFQLPVDKKEGYVNHYWVYGLIVRNKKNARVNMQLLANRGIGTRPFFWPLHNQPVLKKLGLEFEKGLSVSEEISNLGFYIPSGVGLTESQIAQTIEKVREIAFA